MITFDRLTKPVSFKRHILFICNFFSIKLKIHHYNMPFFYALLGKSQARCCLPDHQVRLRSPVRLRDGRVHLHEPHQRRDHFRDGTA